MAIEHLAARVDPERIAETLRRDGAVIVDRMVDTAVMDRVSAEMQPWIDANSTGPDEFSGSRTKRTGALIARSATCRDLVTNECVLAATRSFLSHGTSFQLHLTQIISIEPGQGAQTIHRDQWAFDFFPFPKGYDVQCNTLWAMTDFTEANGATRIVPGSNLAEDRLEFALEDTEPAEMEKGSVLLYSGSVYHGGGANRSNATRSGINITYNLAWLRQEENQYLSVPQAVARELPTDLLRLMGYARGAYALGYIDDIRDPLDVLREQDRSRGLGDLSSAQTRASTLATPSAHR
jgi:hypothetical protein